MIQLEGRNPVDEGLNQGSVTMIRVERGKETDTKIRVILDKARKKRVPVELVGRAKLERMSETGRHQGIIAIAQPNVQWGLQKTLQESGKEVCFLLLDQVQDPHNLGAIIRTSEGAGVDGIVIPKKGTASVGPTVHRVSMGGSLYVPVWQQSLYPAIKTMKEEGVTIIGVDSSSEMDYYDVDLTGPVAFAIGGEDRGVNPTLLEKCDKLVRIPMMGRIHSLNVSVATAIVLYERLRQQESK
ncbi:MAG: 23S rRNA (guanosine(2251)-2'-O)-methyltransferase RlmB [Candidatus Bathyarchaeota archaeon]|nr:23S rRNA (guanosine(2251)-2'-O)-methyltransferase RlmB [Candidatus Bathyarchaeota archaeon]